MNYISINVLYLIYITSFTGFIQYEDNFPIIFNLIRSTSNPLLFVSSLILGSRFIDFNLINKYSFLPIILIIGTLSSYILGNKVIDLRFLFTILCTYSEFFLIQNIAYRSSKLDKSKEYKILNRVSNFLIIIFPIVYFLNFFNLHCSIFVCRDFGNTGMSFMTSEPSYVGLISIFYLSFYFFTLEKISTNKRKIILAISIIMAVLSRSLNTIFWLLLIALIIIIPYFLNYIYSILVSFKLNKNFKYIFFLLSFSIIIFLLNWFYGDISSNNIKKELLLIGENIDFSNISRIDFFNTINIASGDRINYFLASITSNPTNIIWGHGLLSSSSIFEYNLSNLYADFDNNFEISQSFTEDVQASCSLDQSIEKCYGRLGAKPHSFFGLIIFSNGLIGLIYLFKDQIKNLINHILGILKSSNNIQNKNFLQNHYFNFLPFIILFYSSTNTDPFKFISLYLYYSFYYSNKSYK